MNKFKRADRVSNLIHRIISNIIENEIRDTNIGMVTVTGVDLENSLKNAKIYVTVLGEEEEIKSSVDTLNKASGFIRSRLGESVVLRNIPTLKFFYDSSTVDGMYIDKLLNKVNSET